MKAKLLLAASLIAALGALVAGCGGGGGSENLRLGVLLTLSGPYGQIGENMQTGIEQAVKTYNEENDGSVETFLQDDKGDPQTGATKALQLVQQDEVDAIVGLSLSSVALSVIGSADRLGVPIITTNAADDTITGSECSPYVFRTSPSNAMTNNSAKLYITGQPNLAKRAWFAQAENYAYGQGIVSSFEASDEIDVVGSNLAPLENSDWSSQLARIRGSGADAVYVGIAVGTPLLQFLTQAGQEGMLSEMPFVPTIGMPDEYIKELGQSALGLQSGGLWLSWTAEKQHPELAKVNEAIYKATNKTPSFQTLLSYIGTEVVLDALGEEGASKPADQVKALEEVSAKTPIGELAFRAADHQLEAPVFSGTVKPVDEKYGSTAAFVTEGEFGADETLPPESETGCDMGSL